MKSATSYHRLSLAATAAIALTGCRGTIMPELYHPGSAGYQRYNALQYDPYPLDDVAPAVAGTRPKEYDRPVPEVTRGKIYHYPQPGEPAITARSFAPTAVLIAPPAMPGGTVSPLAPPANVPYQTLPPAMPPTSTMVRPPY